MGKYVYVTESQKNLIWKFIDYMDNIISDPDLDDNGIEYPESKRYRLEMIKERDDLLDLYKKCLGIKKSTK